MEPSPTAFPKLNIFVGFPSYGGNGGISSEVPAVREWWAETLLLMAKDDRIGEVNHLTINDTPITMVRNRFVEEARKHGAHILIMIDSDQDPGKHKGDSWFKPFFPTAFDFLCENYHKGPQVLFAPYCGPPTHENVYVFQWATPHSDHGDESALSLEQYTREQAAMMSGIQEAAAGPTGLIMYDMRAFNYIRPPYFKYEFVDKEETQKASTEDVVNLRDISIAVHESLGYNPIHCCWDSWAGHHKPYNVGKPKKIGVELISESLRSAIEENRDSRDRLVSLDVPDWVARLKATPPEQMRMSVVGVAWDANYNSPILHYGDGSQYIPTTDQARQIEEEWCRMKQRLYASGGAITVAVERASRCEIFEQILDLEGMPNVAAETEEASPEPGTVAPQG